ncbi:DoxX family membrane protein [Salinibacterium sp. NSLL150]|uniref:DoxX family protein n=1 Tax=unclassified Salinibacterium TaxID=2632331 RepID=UPI0018CD501A|nr:MULTISPECIES: DoxX family membrane protein [unclassified Salinibacterium]MBH0098579.1 DoxX family membrane protein [Salinibacterium sp. NSLL35]MBH0101334.1 DoxX family membrane protein [Salinibacterium sp. NSLL150]MBH0104093.1 DoxX family membrane protein [Salinibacterium sp. NSLL16]MBH0106854.1 DoxX family membrane protein [Salinibacterium sp. NSLL17]MBH0109374.1 DoxX family membrane protein [Salinibacterium sp. NG22]
MDAVEIAQWALRIVLALAFIAMGVSHFVAAPARTMRAMIPPALRQKWMPSPSALVTITGLCEIAGGLGLLWEPVRFIAGIALVLFLVAVFPANAYAAKDPDRFGKAALPFWPRFAGQLVLIVLVVLAAL